MNYKTIIAHALALTAPLTVLAGGPAPSRDSGPRTLTIVNATAMLTDGSKIKGEFKTANIAGSTSFADNLRLNAADVMSVAFTGQGNSAKIVMSNGDLLHFNVDDNSFKMCTAVGPLEIPVQKICQLALSKVVKAIPEDDKIGLVLHCTFDDEAALEAPAAGPAVKLELGEVKADAGKVGGALFVKPGIAGAEIVFPAGSFSSEGCIEFWASMASGKTEFSTGGDPRFFILSTGDGTEIAHFEYASNNGCGNSGLGGHFCGIRTQTNSGFSYLMPYSDVFKGEDYNGWHHYAFVWSPNQLAVYVDGKLFCHADGKIDPSHLDKDVIMDIPLNRTRGKSFNNKSAFYMDELKIWNKAKTVFDIVE